MEDKYAAFLAALAGLADAPTPSTRDEALLKAIIDRNNKNACFESGEGTGSIQSLIPGAQPTASGNYSFAVGEETTASGAISFAAGSNTVASGENSIAIGRSTIASGKSSVAIGSYASDTPQTTASGQGALAVGYGATASGALSAAIGYGTTANALHSMATGRFTTATGRSATVIGQYNVPDDNEVDTSHGSGARKYLFTIGNGTADNDRSNALTVDWSGNLVTSGTLTIGSTTITEAQLISLLASLN